MQIQLSNTGFIRPSIHSSIHSSTAASMSRMTSRAPHLGANSTRNTYNSLVGGQAATVTGQIKQLTFSTFCCVSFICVYIYMCVCVCVSAIQGRMRELMEHRSLSKEETHLEISYSGAPNLMCVDLPGIVQETGDTTREDVELTRYCLPAL